MRASGRAPIVICEYGTLTTSQVESPSPAPNSVSREDFDFLAGLGNAFVARRDAQTLQWKSLVGVVRTPTGTEIEILPKIFDGEAVERSRKLLVRMLETALDLHHREAQEADIRSFKAPLTEWVARRFLEHLGDLLKRGLRLDYRREEEELPCLQGRLDVRRQLIQPPHRLHLFHVHHDVFDVESPENRLLRSALDKALQCGLESKDWNKAVFAHRLMEGIPPSHDIEGDFRRWRSDRLMTHYNAVRPWCSLVLGENMPLALAGHVRGINLLLPMQLLFERYVAAKLKQRLVDNTTLETKPTPRPLCTDERSGKPLFSMQPDILITCGQSTWVFDTKWKKLEGTDASTAVSMHDVYQLHAYSRQWITGDGEAILIYPDHARFPEYTPLPRFNPGGMRLRIATYDLESDVLHFRDGAEMSPCFKRHP